ncbi:unnamed protein product [Allacma fusca]|uniref:CRAL-TRIO domain-containing protein n=1 Tax=Allacma fusca TaxID=39272 RepID=A0A8J2NG86_9HEXA|nr:unnamed protein product [Allacma fusca]
MEFLRIFDSNYPERLKAGYIINAPKIFELFWPLISPFLSARTLSKVQILGGSRDQWRLKLKESIDFYQLPSDLGGSNTTQHYFSNQLGVSILTLPRAPQYPPEDFTTVDVPAGKRFLLSFSLSAGNRITWNFKTDSHDIGFEFTKNGKGMFPYAKADAHIIVQDGLVDVVEDDSYTLVFDNTYSRYRSKTLHYVICIDGENVAS